VLYQKKQEVHISIVSIDPNKNTCELVGNTCRIPGCWSAYKVIMSVVSADIVFTRVFDEERIRLYQFNLSTFNFELQAVFSIPDNGRMRFYRIVDEYCMFANLDSTTDAWITHIGICDKNGVVTKLEGTGIQLDYNAHKWKGTRVSFTFYNNGNDNLVGFHVGR
jgi:hypothetical protein